MTNTNTRTQTFKKGDRVYLFLDWDRKGTCAWAEWVIDSAGKQQIHLRAPEGHTRKHRLYTESSSCLRLVSETPDPRATALEYAADYLRIWIEHYEGRLAIRISDGERYTKIIRQELEELKSQTPSEKEVKA